MTIFDNPSPTVYESGVEIDAMEAKYHDKYMIVINGRSENGRILGDIVAILTPDEYHTLKKPKPMLPKYRVWEGNSLKLEGH